MFATGRLVFPEPVLVKTNNLRSRARQDHREHLSALLVIVFGIVPEARDGAVLVVVLEGDGRPGVGAVDKRLPARELAPDIGSRERF